MLGVSCLLDSLSLIIQLITTPPITIILPEHGRVIPFDYVVDLFSWDVCALLFLLHFSDAIL